MKLLFVRHGESRGNLNQQFQGWLDEPLTDRGREQALCLAERLRQWSVERAEPAVAVYSSTLTRAFQTASILAQSWSVPLVLDSRLRERDVGLIQGLTWPHVEAHHPQIAETIRQRWIVPGLPDGETTFELAERVWRAVEEIIARTNGRGDGGSVVVVSHGGAINAYFNRPVGRDDEMPFMFRFGNASLSIVEIHNGWPRISLVNDMHHLEWAG
jgi:broad specificity phosphatase PhoE